MKKGFTLIELLVVVLIIGILSSIALPQYTTAVQKARSSEAVQLMGSLRGAGERYYLQANQFPGTDLTVLDIEIPGTVSGNTVSTKNFKFSTSGTTGAYIITAERIGGSNAYKLYTSVQPDGTAKRFCGSAIANDGKSATAATGNAAKICSAITNGHPTDGNW